MAENLPSGAPKGLAEPLEGRMDGGECPIDSLGFERLISVLSATFIDLPADRIDDHIEQALGQVVEFLDPRPEHRGAAVRDA